MSVNAVNSDGSLSKIAGGINTNDTDIIKSDLSYVEPYTTATAAHAQGDCFVMNTGQLVRATSAIDIGDTITLNTNVSAVSIIELLAEKVDKVTGKGLSTNDYTDKDKATTGKLALPNTVVATDKTPFLSRQALSPEGFTGYVREKLIGASYAWNQLVQNGDFASNNNWSPYNSSFTSLSISNNIATLTFINVDSSTYKNAIYQQFSDGDKAKIGHKYLIRFDVKLSYNGSFGLDNYGGTTAKEFTANVWDSLYTIWNATSEYNTILLRARSTPAINDTAQIKNVIVSDLTLDFGSTIADYLYNLPNKGGITKLRDMGFPIDKYTPYGYGLYSVKTSGKKIINFNVWDEVWESGSVDGTTGEKEESPGRIRSKNYISVVPNTTYYCLPPSTSTGLNIYFYTIANLYIGNTGAGSSQDYLFTTPSNCTKIYFSTYGTNTNTYNHDICINISDPNKNGTYEPYSDTTYPLGNDELRGKFDLVNGEIVASGDVKESNGEITRNWKLIDLGSLAWSNFSTGAFQSQDIKNIVKKPNSNNDIIGMICPLYLVNPTNTSFENMNIGVDTNGVLYVRNDNYPSDAAAFKTAMSGVYLVYELATPTTEQSTPFADPMSLIGATTEEYIDTRDVPCPVGAERQYMGESDDRMEFPSIPGTDGKRILTSYKSGDETQYVWEKNDMPFIPFMGNLINNTFSAFLSPANGASSFKLKLTPKGGTNTSISFIIFSRYTVTAVTVAANTSNKIVQNESALNILVSGSGGSMVLNFDTNNNYALVVGSSIYDGWCIFGFIRGGNNTFDFETVV